ncbi:MAG TPA: sigma-70 family RNA polymerase sigma factor [Acidimicrobiales bacterium]|jgi:RNA polymerase sigma factor (sigma-70 family)|nr:sigma-70 family RNA polymerase sigma factor [Acidimicrobiales bacterium]
MAEAPNAGEAYRELAPAVLGYLRSQRVAEPEDVLGEVFLQVARDLRRGRFKGDADGLRRWVFSIAHNRAVDAHRKRSRNRSDPSDEVEDARVADAPPDPVDPELVDALAALSADQREVVLLRFVADLPLEAVAKVTGRTTGAVKALQHRALENLRRSVSRGSD